MRYIMMYVMNGKIFVHTHSKSIDDVKSAIKD